MCKFIFSVVSFLLIFSCVTYKDIETTYKGGKGRMNPYVQLDGTNTRIYSDFCSRITNTCTLWYDLKPIVHNPTNRYLYGMLICEYSWNNEVIKKKRISVLVKPRSSYKVHMWHAISIMRRGNAKAGCYVKYVLRDGLYE